MSALRKQQQSLANFRKAEAINMRNKVAYYRDLATTLDREASSLLAQAAEIEKRIDSGEFDKETA